jgi:aconitate hydratase
LSRKDPAYVQRAKDIQSLEGEELIRLHKQIQSLPGCAGIALKDFAVGSAIFARKPGDGSAREQAASCQRVLGASANFALEYATKRYRSNLINWGILPFVIGDESALSLGAYIFFPGIRKAVQEKAAAITGYALGNSAAIAVSLGELTDAERQILLDGCLINHYAGAAYR